MKTFTLLMGLLLTALGAAAQNSGTTGPLTWNYDAGTKTLSITGEGAMPDYTEESDRPWHALRNEIETVTIGHGVTTVGNNAFTQCSKLQSITLPATLAKVGFHGFSFCKALQSIALPAALSEIGNYAFLGCLALTAFKVAAGNAHFAAVDGVLYNKAKTHLIYYPIGKAGTSFSVPAGVTKIESYAFDNAEKLQSITLPAGLKTIGYQAFEYCAELQSIALPEGITKIEFFTFYECTALQSVVVPGTVTSIEHNAFSGCTALKSIRIPSAVRSIGNNAFSRCTGLTEVTVAWDTPLDIYPYVFSGVNTSNVTLKVPVGMKEKYQAAPVWKDFGKIEEGATGLPARPEALGLRIGTAAGKLRFTAERPVEVRVFTPSGSCVAVRLLPAGESALSLPQGIYLVQAGTAIGKYAVVD